MSFNVQDLSDSELLEMLGQVPQQTKPEANTEEQQIDFTKTDPSKLSNEQLMQALNTVGQTKKVGTLGSIAAGALEGYTDLGALGEFVTSKVAPERPENIPSPYDIQYESLMKDKPSFTDLLLLSDDDFVPVVPFGPSKKEKETASQEALFPATTFQQNLPESDNELNEILRRGARFGTAALQAGAGLGGAAEAGLLGLAGETSRKLGLGEPISTAIELGIPQIVGRQVFNSLGKRKLPKPVTQDIIKTAEKLDIKRLPASLKTQSNAINFLENVAQQSVFGTNAYENLFTEIKENLTTKINEELNNLSRRQFANLSEAGESLQNQFIRAHQEARETSRAYYNLADKKAQGTRAPVSDLLRSLVRTSEKLGQSFQQGDKEKSVQGFINSLIRNLAKNARKDGTVPLQNLVSQRRSIRSMINYEDIGGAKEFLKGVDNALTKLFEKVGRANPEWYKSLVQADKNFANQAKFFRNKLMKNVLFGESPEGIVNAINKPSDIAKLEKALKVEGIRPETKSRLNEIINGIKRRKVEDIMLDRVTGADGKINLTKKDFIPKKQREFVAALLPKKSREVIKDVEKISKAVAEGSQKYANTSRSFSNAQDVAFMVTAVSGLLSGNPTAFLKSATPAATYFIASKLLTNEKFMSGLSKVRSAVSRGNAKQYNQLISQLSVEINDTLDKNNISRDQILPTGFNDASTESN